MLSSYDRRRFNEIVSGLLEEDPGFATRPAVERPQQPRRPGLALLLWASMPFLVAMGGWTGALIAVIAAGYGLRLWFRPSAAEIAHARRRPAATE